MFVFAGLVLLLSGLVGECCFWVVFLLCLVFGFSSFVIVFVVNVCYFGFLLFGLGWWIRAYC